MDDVVVEVFITRCAHFSRDNSSRARVNEPSRE